MEPAHAVTQSLPLLLDSRPPLSDEHPPAEQVSPLPAYELAENTKQLISNNFFIYPLDLFVVKVFLDH